VRVAYDGAEAIRICADWSPTHVLMDLGLPGMDGYEAAAGCVPTIPTAVSGCRPQWLGQRRAPSARSGRGFDQHLVKPVGVAAMKALLAS
jgi:CheY-like chemotaxis protein